jgi:hypothetical protein
MVTIKIFTQRYSRETSDENVVVCNPKLRFSIIKGNDNGCANISISLNLESIIK